MKIKIHPLFLVAGLTSALFGGLPIFIICALTALLHECGHIFCAARLGFKCSEISLMPFGAAAICDLDGISPADEVRLAAAGPAVNLFLCVAVAGLWWFAPQTYAYTDLVFYASAAMFLLNLLPAYPLDGGRIAKCVLIKFLSPRAANIFLRALNAAVVCGLVLLYVFALKNVTVLAVAAMLLFSAFGKEKPLEKINFLNRRKRRGREIRYIILDENATYRDALKFVDSGRYVIFQIYGEEFLDEVSEDELFERLMTFNLYDKIIGRRAEIP